MVIASLIIFALYGMIILTYIIISLFIVYHLVKFSVASEMKILMLILFIMVSSGLLFSNLLLFFSIDWNMITGNLFFR